MNVIKRDGKEVSFSKEKVRIAIEKANEESRLNGEKTLTKDEINIINKRIYETLRRNKRALSVEEIQDLIEKQIMKLGCFDLAKRYIVFRYKRNLIRKGNTTDESVLSLINHTNEDIKQENSNKNPMVISTQRDYMAGEVSKDLTHRILLPPDVVEADKQGIIHFHDADYYAQQCHNCDLVNLEDMLQNGTVISGVKIDKPHSFSTACTIATQIIAQVASSQYGGQSITLTHLAPFVDISRQKIKNEVLTEMSLANITVDEYNINEIVERRLKKEIEKGIQTIQYQVTTLMTTNGQAPFITVFMYLNEAKNEQEKADLALIIEETIKQRYQGVKNEKGVWVTPAFPKLIYALEEDNISKDSKYYYLTELAAKCTAKRLVPDYISEKVMKELKEENCFPSMGCVDGNEIISYRVNEKLYVESFRRMWERLSDMFEVKTQYDIENNPNVYMDLSNVKIFDTKTGFVDTKRIIRNTSDNWVDVHMSNGRRLLCTSDHPLEILRNGTQCVVGAENLTSEDLILINSSQAFDVKKPFNSDKAWLLGFMLCDGCYQGGSLFASIAATGEDEIEQEFRHLFNKYFNLQVETILQERGKKGRYKDLMVRSDGTDKVISARQYFTKNFGGINKMFRHIPNEVFSWYYNAKVSFMAGMIDADGYINPHNNSKVQIGSTNKELALQQMALAQSIGCPAKIYHNHYSNHNKKLIRYRVEFRPSLDLVKAIKCVKKAQNFQNIHNIHNVVDNKEAKVIEVIPIKKTDYSYDVTTESEHFEVSGIYSHNCRSFLSPYKDEDGKYKFYGRFNKGVVTINLPDVALSSKGNYDEFWRIFDERLELCHKALLCRYKRLKGTLSDVAPILWQHGALSRLKKGETIDNLLVGGYSSISLGYAGLCECVKYMTGKSHTDTSATPFALEIMKYMNKKCDDWNKDLNLGFGIYGSPIESTTYTFAKCLQKRFGVIEGVTDKNYITNSYHVHVTEPIDAFSKLQFESQFQALSTGGAISYVEVPNMQHNIEGVLSIINFIYDNIMYAELNTKSDYCQVCGYDGEIQIIEDESGKLIWKCPNCDNTDQDKMNVSRRTCGYIGTNFWNQGRTQEIKERYVHIGDNE